MSSAIMTWLGRAITGACFAAADQFGREASAVQGVVAAIDKKIEAFFTDDPTYTGSDKIIRRSNGSSSGPMHLFRHLESLGHERSGHGFDEMRVLKVVFYALSILRIRGDGKHRNFMQDTVSFSPLGAAKNTVVAVVSSKIVGLFKRRGLPSFMLSMGVHMLVSTMVDRIGQVVYTRSIKPRLVQHRAHLSDSKTSSKVDRFTRVLCRVFENSEDRKYIPWVHQLGSNPILERIYSMLSYYNMKKLRSYLNKHAIESTLSNSLEQCIQKKVEVYNALRAVFNEPLGSSDNGPFRFNNGGQKFTQVCKALAILEENKTVLMYNAKKTSFTNFVNSTINKVFPNLQTKLPTKDDICNEFNLYEIESFLTYLKGVDVEVQNLISSKPYVLDQENIPILRESRTVLFRRFIENLKEAKLELQKAQDATPLRKEEEDLYQAFKQAGVPWIQGHDQRGYTNTEKVCIEQANFLKRELKLLTIPLATDLASAKKITIKALLASHPDKQADATVGKSSSIEVLISKLAQVLKGNISALAKQREGAAGCGGGAKKD